MTPALRVPRCVNCIKVPSAQNKSLYARMFQGNPTKAPNGLEADRDAAALLRNLGAAVLGIALVLTIIYTLRSDYTRPSVMVAGLVGASMLALVHFGYLRAAAHTLCWGLLCSGCTAMYIFGHRSTGVLVLPLAIMSGGWLLGRTSAVLLAATGSAVSVWVLVEQTHGKVRPIPPVFEGDVAAHIAIFVVTAMLGVAMARTLRGQYEKVNALAIGLQEANATLEARVAERSAQLVSVQQKALDTEKLTSLGSMVAGISHELNTPVGIALTVSTSMESSLQQLSQRVNAGKLTRTDMADFLSGATEMSALITQSVTRAADLVTSFKQVAVDQTSEQRRAFELARVVADNVAALKPSFGKLAVSVSVDVPAGILCDTYPGPLGMIITNLVQNAVVHGFDGKGGGHIAVTARSEGQIVQVEISDDGVGMEPQVLARIFEPFFTTRLGRGGSGLGLSISHRMATSVLGGNLVARSQSGNGTTFTLTFPKELTGGL